MSVTLSLGVLQMFYFYFLIEMESLSYLNRDFFSLFLTLLSYLVPVLSPSVSLSFPRLTSKFFRIQKYGAQSTSVQLNPSKDIISVSSI